MGNISIEKIETMLRVYRDRLAQAETQPIDYASCMRFSAQISLLEDLCFIAHQEAAQQSVQLDDACALCGRSHRDHVIMNLGHYFAISHRR
jgi:hypothetical protein